MIEKLLSLAVPWGENGSLEVKPPEEIPQGGMGSTHYSTGNQILSWGITFFLTVGVLTCLFFLLWGGIQWIMSSGDKNKLQNARNKIIYAIAGLALMFLSIFIITFIGSLFGIDYLATNPILNPPDCPVRGRPC